MKLFEFRQKWKKKTTKQPTLFQWINKREKEAVQEWEARVSVGGYRVDRWLAWHLPILWMKREWNEKKKITEMFQSIVLHFCFAFYLFRLLLISVLMVDDCDGNGNSYRYVYRCTCIIKRMHLFIFKAGGLKWRDWWLSLSFYEVNAKEKIAIANTLKDWRICQCAGSYSRLLSL